MKKLSKLKIIIAFIALTSVTISCNKEDVPGIVVDPTVTGVAKTNPNLSILVQALVKTELASTLQGAGPFTVFAPTNDAFTAFLRSKLYTSINDVPTAVLKQILLNHVVSGTNKSTSLTTGYISTLAKPSPTATNSISMFVNKTATAVRLNGIANVTTADIMASNGVIHVVNNVIDLPTIVTHATANPNFTSLVTALTGAGQPDFVTILSGTGPFTVMAPTNTAFSELNTELAPGGTAGVSAENMTKVLNYHVANGNVLAASLTNGQMISTLKIPEKYTIQIAAGSAPTILDVKNRVARITATDVQCSNGVIHVLSKVLLPTF
jgi:uncharacterized surface protein with fasciclin (FAS1) repeats